MLKFLKDIIYSAYSFEENGNGLSKFSGFFQC